MARVALSQVVSFPPRSLTTESIGAELLRTREICQQMLDAMSLEVLQLRRELQARDRLAPQQQSAASGSSAAPRCPARGLDDEIPFDEIEAALAASPVEH
jgi:hypothetical protein